MLTHYNMVWPSLYMYVSGVYIRTSVYVCIHTWWGVCSRVSVDISVCVFVCVRDVCICVRSGVCEICACECVCKRVRWFVMILPVACG